MYEFFVWYLATVILPIAFLVISWPVVWYKLMFTNDITPEMRKFPQRGFAIMGSCDTLFNLLSTVPVPHLGGDLSNVLSQAVLPINMLGSMMFLKTKFQKPHYLGAALVVYGIIVKLSPSFGSPSFTGGFGWIMLMIVAQVPAAASNIYKELGLKAANLDVWYANAWIGVYQLFLGLATFWTMYIGAFVSPHPALTSGTFGTFLKNANQCFFGDQVIVKGTTMKDCIGSNAFNTFRNASVTGGEPECDVDCSVDGTVLGVFCVFIVFNITYNMLMLYVFKKGSSVLFVVANAVRLPLVSALNSWGWISGPAVDEFTRYDTLALLILVIAIVVYYSVEEEQSEESQRNLSNVSQGELDSGLVVSPKVAGGFRARLAENSVDHTASGEAELLST